MSKRFAGMIGFSLLAAVVLTACSGGKEEKDVPSTQAKIEQQEGQTDSKVPGNAFVSEQVLGNFTTEDIKGNEVTQDIFADYKVNIVNIWGTFCGPCLSEMPSLGKLQEEYKDKGVQIVGIVTDVLNQDGTVLDSQVDVANEAVEKTGADYIHIIPNKELLASYLNQVSAVPTTLFLDENGREIMSPITGALEEKDWEKVISVLLEEQKG